tara:strand:+ start:9799 stop:10248 length:450 start_codon:yes stop_codon:yes gene_type:complete
MKTKKLKLALSNYPTGIVCVFSKVKGKDYYDAIIVNSFTSVSLSPPLILWSLDINSSKYNNFKNTKNQIISILSKNQKNFAIKIAFNKEKVGNLEFKKILNSSICTIYCSKHKKIKAGDHLTFLLKIKKISTIKKAKPLVYYKKNFTSI